MADERQRVCVEGEGGLHRDGDKPRLVDYFPMDLLWQVGEIAALNNAKSDDYPGGKYPDLPGGIPNYKAGIRVSKYLDSSLRHLLKVVMGEDVDPESGRSHLAHLICNLGMAWWTIRHRPDLDDRNAMPNTKEVE